MRFVIMKLLGHWAMLDDKSWEHTIISLICCQSLHLHVLRMPMAASEEWLIHNQLLKVQERENREITISQCAELHRTMLDLANHSCLWCWPESRSCKRESLYLAFLTEAGPDRLVGWLVACVVQALKLKCSLLQSKALVTQQATGCCTRSMFSCAS